MTKRSTRTRIRFQAKKAAHAIDEAMEHLLKLDVHANGRSEQINERLPQLIVMLEGAKAVLLQFRKEI